MASESSSTTLEVYFDLPDFLLNFFMILLKALTSGVLSRSSELVSSVILFLGMLLFFMLLVEDLHSR